MFTDPAEHATEPGADRLRHSQTGGRWRDALCFLCPWVRCRSALWTVCVFVGELRGEWDWRRCVCAGAAERQRVVWSDAGGRRGWVNLGDIRSCQNINKSDLPKNEHLLSIYSPSDHPRSFFRRTVQKLKAWSLVIHQMQVRHKKHIQVTLN